MCSASCEGVSCHGTRAYVPPKRPCAEQYLKRGSQHTFKRHGVAANVLRTGAKVTVLRIFLSAYTCKGHGAAIFPAEVSVQKSRRKDRGSAGTGVLEKGSTPLFFFPICSSLSCANVTAFRKAYCVISKMSCPKTKESKEEAAGDENMSPLRRPKAAAIPTGEKVQPAGGPGGPLRCRCGGDHSPIHDDLGLFRRERWGPVDMQAEEDHREAIEKENDARRQLLRSCKK
jgi:hypothetical protein